ncbi:hypothetical protein [Polluticaenibacter yanchengensis]|uniref:Lipocalin-like domain-containing protein n=1 Tax=Polluticaenibacter yanchengensis TaxID=3014562 RepID=A0ABT4UFS8_9BACT|nr:hypothetical protein [Chitinophagaceae bacterium LY-5]
MKKFSLYSIFIAAFSMLCFVVFSSFDRSLENYFVGEWDETFWDYKKADNYLLKGWGLNQSSSAPAAEVRYHQGEKWVFKADGELEILNADSVSYLNWRLKGRGNILEISDGNVTEHFDIKKYSSNKIELNYISDIQVKESARLIFTQSKRQHVTKI